MTAITTSPFPPGRVMVICNTSARNMAASELPVDICPPLQMPLGSDSGVIMVSKVLAEVV